MQAVCGRLIPVSVLMALLTASVDVDASIQA